MIYCLNPNLYPKEEQVVEEIIYKDENEFEWRIVRVQNGFFVKYFGDPYFSDSVFACENKHGQTRNVKNTNCIFVQNTDFETFAEVRDIIKLGFTDDIWETFREMFDERIKNQDSLLESEINF
jgi:hypothetical protein